MNEHPTPDSADHETAQAAEGAVDVGPGEQPRSVMRKEMTRGQLLTLIIAFVVAAAGAVTWLQLDSWQESIARRRLTHRDEPPADWKGIRLGLTREEVARMFVASGIRWPSVKRPGLAPTVWANQMEAEINGHPVRIFALRFEDGERWDYGRFPGATSDIVDVETLVGELDSKAKLTGLSWMVNQSKYDKSHESVPVEVLRELGTAHSSQREITDAGNVFHWNWPFLHAYFTTADSRLTVQVPGTTGS